jgi:hypothetical protein
MTPSRQRALVTILIGLGLLTVGFFGWRTVHAFREFRGHRPPHPPFENRPAETDVELIRDWMTIPFIAKMYHVPPPVILEALQIPADKKNEEKSLKDLNDEYFPDKPGYVLTTVKAVVQANIPPPTVAPPATAIPPATMVPPSAP